jgi:hypothetical protein
MTIVLDKMPYKLRVTLGMQYDGWASGTAFSDGFNVFVRLDPPLDAKIAQGPHVMALARYPQLRIVSSEGLWEERAILLAETLLREAYEQLEDWERRRE